MIKKEKFKVTGMTCAACSAHVDKAVKGVRGVTECNVNLLSNSMEVTYDDLVCSDNDISLAVIKAGYDAYLPHKARIKEEKDDKLMK